MSSSQIPPGTDLSKVPAGKPPAGVTPNLENPSSLTPTLIGLCAFLIAWGTTFGLIRIWVNRKKLGVGDGEYIEFETHKRAEMLTWCSLCDRRRDPFDRLLLDSAVLCVNKLYNDLDYH